MEPMKDAVGRDILLADTVVTTHRNYADLYKAVVVGFTPKKVKVRMLGYEYTKFPNQVAVVI